MFWSLMRRQWRAYAVGSLFVAVGIASALAYPQVIGRIIDDGIAGGHAERINTLALVMAVLLAIEAIATFIRNYLFNLAAERMAADLQQRAFEHILAQDIAFFDAETTGALTARLAATIPALQRVFGDELADALRNVLWGVGGTALLFYTSTQLSIVVLLSVPPIVAASWLLGRRVKRDAAAMQEAFADSGTVVSEAVGAIRTVRAFGQEASEAARHRGALTRALVLAKRKIAASAAASSVSMLTGEGAAVLAIWAGGRLIVRGQLTSGALISFILYAFLVARGFRNAADYWNETSRSLGAAEWIVALLGRTPSMPSGHRAPGAAALGEVTFEQVAFHYPSRPDHPAVSGIQLRISPGETVAFVGRSGSGKSTLHSLILRLYDPSEGRVLIDGMDLRQVEPQWLRAQVAAVLQDPTLFTRSIAENIRFGHRGVSDGDVAGATIIARADEFIARLPNGLETQVGDRGVRLSGGQRQRLAIARAVIKRPRVLLLDEATSALDAENESLVLDALRALDYRPTTVIVAHRLSTVVNVDRVVVLDAGRILAVGRHDDLLRTCDVYRQLVDTQLVPA